MTRRLGFLLIDGFAMMSYASIVEPFRAANLLSGQALYSWQHLSTGAPGAEASNGAAIAVNGDLHTLAEIDTLFIFAAGNPSAFDDEAVFASLRRLAAHGVALAGVSGGPYLLARAGLLNGRSATIHWEHQPAFAEAFPNVLLQQALYVIDGRYITCAGGVAGLDLAVDLITREHGAALGTAVGEWHIRTQSREGSGPQRMSLSERYRVWNPRVVRVLSLMEAHIAEPLSREVLAQGEDVSVRQLERLFTHHLGATISETYRRIRLMRAMALLGETSLGITEIGVACGFGSPSHFSRAFAEHYGMPPRNARKSPLHARRGAEQDIGERRG
ncbi:transcriptional regulator, AraC family with amidase-like domain [Sphingomonas sp. YR710]|uniref:GlxA family transcriptional regulator n=1 Tax=Sphingomonas sp. YR710 TaxID=1882773 RepID=UPI00087E1221|nr:GlxA family transcriptional regulator [Sphingomonas sp. YR710]SDC05259.1 transcriptional regulator, AraC family with amidase-like domain [Sphingomonas sp. YR710]